MGLLTLLTGVILVQWPRQSPEQIVVQTSLPPPPMDSYSSFDLGVRLDPDAAMGFLAVLAACFTSGFASVYLEKLLKQTDASIWVRNVQLGVFGSIMAAIVAGTQDGAQILEDGFFQGYSLRVVCVILTNALGGLLCAAVLKYADNILRCFSTALSIILTSVLSAAVLRDMEPDVFFIIGAILAIFATFVYNVGLYELINTLRRFIPTG